MNPVYPTQLPQNQIPLASSLNHNHLLYAPYPPAQTQLPKKFSKNSKRSTQQPAIIPTIPSTTVPTSIPMSAMPLPSRPIPIILPPMIPLLGYPYPNPYLPFNMQPPLPTLPTFPNFPMIPTPNQFIPPVSHTNNLPSEPAPVLTPHPPNLEVVEVHDSPTIEPIKLDVPTTGIDSNLHSIVEYMKIQVEKLESSTISNFANFTSTDKSMDSGYTSNVSPETITSPNSSTNVNDFNTIQATVINQPPNVLNNISTDLPINNILQTSPNAVIPNVFPKYINSLDLPLGSSLPVTVNTFNTDNTYAENQSTPMLPIEATAAQERNTEDTVVESPAKSTIDVFDWDFPQDQRSIEISDVQFQLDLLYQAAENGSGRRLQIAQDHNQNTPLLQNFDLFPSLRNADGSLKPRENDVNPEGMHLGRIKNRPSLDPPPIEEIDIPLTKTEWNFVVQENIYQKILFSKTIEKLCYFQHNAILITTILSLKKYGKQTSIEYLKFFWLRCNEIMKLKNVNDAWASICINLLLNAALLVQQIQSIQNLKVEWQISLLTELTFDTRQLIVFRKEFPEKYSIVKQWVHQALESVPDLDKTTVELIRVALNRDISFPKNEKRIQEMVNETGVERTKLLRVWQQVHDTFHKKVDEEGFFYFLN